MGVSQHEVSGPVGLETPVLFVEGMVVISAQQYESSRSVLPLLAQWMLWWASQHTVSGAIAVPTDTDAIPTTMTPS